MTFPTQIVAELAADRTEAGDATPDLVEAVLAIQNSVEGYEHAREYDDINLWEQNVLSREGRTLRQADIQYDPNFTGVVIDSVANKLKMSGRTVVAGDVSDKAATTAAQTALDELWRTNKLKLYYRVWDRRACRDGDAYIVVWPADQDASPDVDMLLDLDAEDTSGDDADLDGPVTAVNVTYVDPRMGRMFYDAENPRIKRFFAQMWEVTFPGESKPRTRCNLYYPDRIEKYVSGKGVKGAKPSSFQRWVDPDDDGDNDYPGSDADPDNDPASADSWPMPNPYRQIPVFHLRTDLEYGKPLARNAFALQDAISKLVEMQMVTVEFQGYPQRYAIQEADSLGTQSIREDPLAESSPATWDRDFADTAYSTTAITAGAISNETGSNYEANPGGMQVFKGFREVSQFQTADPNAFLEPWREYGKAISSTTGTPLYKFQGLGGNVPSGEALKIIEAPLIDLVQTLFDLFGDTWAEMLEFALTLLGFPDAKVSIAWDNPGTTDLLDVWKLLELKVRLGVPREAAFAEAGIPEQQAQEWSKTYTAEFALAQQEQSRADMFASQAEQAKWAAVAAKVAAGVPQRVALVEAGFKPDDVDVWIADSADSLDLTHRVTLLGQLAAAAQQLGAAVTLGVLNSIQAQQVIVGVMGDVLPVGEAPEFDVELAVAGASGGGGAPPPPDQPQDFGGTGAPPDPADDLTAEAAPDGTEPL